MMKKICLLPLLMAGQALCAQEINFELIPSGFIEYETATIAFSDLDGDGDQDFIATGNDVNAIVSSGEVSRKLTIYTNDGTANFTAEDMEGTGVENGLRVLDLDGDGDDDLFCAGWATDNFGGYVARAALNDGLGNFTFYELGMDDKRIRHFEFSDVDNDGDSDLLTMENSIDDLNSLHLYLNDGNGNFEEVFNTDFIAFPYRDIVFLDADMDGDEDLFIAGSEGSWPNTVFDNGLYLNDGVGNFEFSYTFSLDLRNPYRIDFDSDGDDDLLMRDVNSNEFLFYVNDGTGSFEEGEVLCEGVSIHRAKIVDIENDGDPDVFVNGSSFFEGLMKLYVNDGNGVFNETLTNIDQVRTADFGFADIDGEFSQDLVMLGFDFDENDDDENTSRVYLNVTEGIGPLQEEEEEEEEEEETSIQENTFRTKVSMYPNPVQDVLHIDFEQSQEALRLSLYDISGRLVEQKSFETTAQIRYPIHQEAGVYILHLSAGDQHLKMQVLKK